MFSLSQFHIWPLLIYVSKLNIDILILGLKLYLCIHFALSSNNFTPLENLRVLIQDLIKLESSDLVESQWYI